MRWIQPCLLPCRPAPVSLSISQRSFSGRSLRATLHTWVDVEQLGAAGRDRPLSPK